MLPPVAIALSDFLLKKNKPKTKALSIFFFRKTSVFPLESPDGTWYSVSIKEGCPVTIMQLQKEHCPAARLIGKRYTGQANWAQWWENGWFDILEKLPVLPFSQDAYISACRMVNGSAER